MTNPIHELTAEIMYEMIVDLKSATQTEIKTFEELEGNYFLLNKERVFKANFDDRQFEEIPEPEIPEEIKEMRIQ